MTTTVRPTMRTLWALVSLVAGAAEVAAQPHEPLLDTLGQEIERTMKALAGDDDPPYFLILWHHTDAKYKKAKEQLTRYESFYSRSVARLPDDDTVLAAVDRGAESGGVPVSAASPGILVSQIEVQKKDKSQDRLPILPAPLVPTPFVAEDSEGGM